MVKSVTDVYREKVIHACRQCDGKGLDGGCPRCGLTPRTVISGRLIPAVEDNDIIPEYYKGKIWTKPNGSQLVFDDNLDKVHNLFLKGELPKFSMFISAPPKSGKMLYAYSCMQAALVQKFKVAPLLTASDWRRVYRVSQMQPLFKLYRKYRWDDLIIKDVVFIVIDDSEDRFDIISMLKTIYDSRATFNLPTFVISDYKVTELVSKFDSNDYNKIYNPSQERDYYRYPVIMNRAIQNGGD